MKLKYNGKKREKKKRENSNNKGNDRSTTLTVLAEKRITKERIAVNTESE